MRKGSKRNGKVREAARQQWHDKSLQRHSYHLLKSLLQKVQRMYLWKRVQQKRHLWKRVHRKRHLWKKVQKKRQRKKQPLEKGQQEKGAIKIEVKKEQPEEKAPAKKMMQRQTCL